MTDVVRHEALGARGPIFWARLEENGTPLRRPGCNPILDQSEYVAVAKDRDTLETRISCLLAEEFRVRAGNQR